MNTVNTEEQKQAYQPITAGMEMNTVNTEEQKQAYQPITAGMEMNTVSTEEKVEPLSDDMLNSMMSFMTGTTEEEKPRAQGDDENAN